MRSKFIKLLNLIHLIVQSLF